MDVETDMIDETSTNSNAKAKQKKTVEQCLKCDEYKPVDNIKFNDYFCCGSYVRKVNSDSAGENKVKQRRGRPPKKCHLCQFNFESGEDLTDCNNCGKLVHSDSNKGDSDSCKNK